jgi:hypothetical protein
MSHYREYCEHGKIIRQCRCPGGIAKVIKPCPFKCRQWKCGTCGYHPDSTSGWCAVGCGRDYNRMILVENDV